MSNYLVEMLNLCVKEENKIRIGSNVMNLIGKKSVDTKLLALVPYTSSRLKSSSIQTFVIKPKIRHFLPTDFFTDFVKSISQ